ncbi:hypothetical protein [Campylobacter mucosalis]|uniref:hypothetical protein n=1 Tax=Campylobacter mucosalis TaxID=202 RepID=UPI001470322D|nr:hypothetical protein [Campylobacter mucosalis]
MLKKEIRILPMSKNKEFNNSSIEKIHVWFLQAFKEEMLGKYYYRKKGLDTTKCSMILFQYDNYIIASAIFLESFKDNSMEGYSGYFQFEPDSIQIFDPIKSKQIQEKFEKKLGQAKHKISYDKLSDVLARKKNVKISL